MWEACCTLSQATCCSLALVTWRMCKEGAAHSSLSGVQEFGGGEQQLSPPVTDLSLGLHLRRPVGPEKEDDG